MSNFLQSTLNGLSVGALYSLVAVGFSLVWACRRTVNFAHGSFYTAGAYATFLVLSGMTGTTGGASVGAFLVAILLSTAVGGLLGAGIYYSLYLPLERSRTAEATPYIATLAVGAVIAASLHLLYSQNVSIVPHALPEGRVKILDAQISYTQIGILTLTLVSMLALHAFLTYTRHGRAMRAMSHDSVAAELMGIRVQRLFLLSLVVSSGLAAAAGGLVAEYYGVIDPNMGLAIAVKGLTAAVVGGLGSVFGAVAGGLLVGLGEAYLTNLGAGPWKEVVVFGLLIAVLLIRPSGLLGASRKAVGDRELAA